MPSLPPYAHLDNEAVQCIAQASSRQQIPELLLHAILIRENGRTGQCVKNANGSYDCGLGQINTQWFPHFEKMGVSPQTLVQNSCQNIHASAYILRRNFELKKDWFYATVSYNIGPNKWTPERYAVGHRYATNVINQWWALYRWTQTAGQAARVNRPANGPLTFSAPSQE